MRRGVAWQPLMRQIAGWSGVMLGAWLLSLLLMQALFGRAINRLQILQLGRELALIVRLTELTLERYPPAPDTRINRPGPGCGAQAGRAWSHRLPRQPAPTRSSTGTVRQALSLSNAAACRSTGQR